MPLVAFFIACITCQPHKRQFVYDVHHIFTEVLPEFLGRSVKTVSCNSDLLSVQKFSDDHGKSSVPCLLCGILSFSFVAVSNEVRSLAMSDAFKYTLRMHSRSAGECALSCHVFSTASKPAVVNTKFQATKRESLDFQSLWCKNFESLDALIDRNRGRTFKKHAVPYRAMEYLFVPLTSILLFS